jgi:hypothetical protein
MLLVRSIANKQRPHKATNAMQRWQKQHCPTSDVTTRRLHAHRHYEQQRHRASEAKTKGGAFMTPSPLAMMMSQPTATESPDPTDTFMQQIADDVSTAVVDRVAALIVEAMANATIGALLADSATWQTWHWLRRKVAMQW